MFFFCVSLRKTQKPQTALNSFSILYIKEKLNSKKRKDWVCQSVKDKKNICCGSWNENLKMDNRKKWVPLSYFLLFDESYDVDTTDKVANEIWPFVLI